MHESPGDAIAAAIADLAEFGWAIFDDEDIAKTVQRLAPVPTRLSVVRQDGGLRYVVEEIRLIQRATEDPGV